MSFVYSPPNLFDVVRKQTGLWRPRGNGTSIETLGFGSTTGGTAVARNTANTNIFTSTRRVGFQSAAVAGSSCSTRHNTAQFFRSSVAGTGGWRYLARFGLSVLSGGQNRFFCGLRVGAGELPNGDPSALVDMVGLAFDVADTQYQVMHNDAAGTATKVAMGAGMPAPGTVNVDHYEVEIVCPVGANPNITVRVIRLDTNALVETVISTNLPTADTMLSPQVWMNNGTTAAAVEFDVIGQLIEAPM